MRYLPRVVEDKLRLYRDSFPCVLVSGARQTGKSTLLKHLFGRACRTFVFDPVQDLYGARRDPDLFLNNNPPPLILDEIQYAPELVPAIKRRVDEDRRPGQYLITGSQQWQVMRHLAESMAGRIAMLDLAGFCLAETVGQAGPSWASAWLAAARGTVEEAETRLRAYASGRRSSASDIWRGSFPEVLGLPEAAVHGWMRGYVNTYLQRDVRLALDVHDETTFAAFVALCAALTAQECNFSQLGRDLGLAAPTARRWLQVLRSTYQWLELPALSRNPVKRVSLKPKGYFADTGLACHLMRISSPEGVQGHPAFGRLFETLAVLDFWKQVQREPMPPTFYHYRQHSGAEVDLVLETDGWLFPVEIKAAAMVTPGDAYGFGAMERNMRARVGLGLVIYSGREILRLGPRCLAVPYDLVHSGEPP